MSILKLEYPVYTLENTILLPEGSELTPETLNDLISSNNSSYTSHPLLNYGSIRKDILDIMSSPPYNLIFSNADKNFFIMELLKNIHINFPILESMDYFKQNDYYTYRHTITVFVLSVLLSNDLVKNHDEVIRGCAASLNYDIGKTCIPLNILQKTTPLTEEERSIVKNHPTAGYLLLSYYHKNPENASSIIARDHHERSNGSGYPRGIYLADPFVEIMTVCDIYDALIIPRPYRLVAYDCRTACEELTDMADRYELNPNVVRSLISHHRKNKPHYTALDVSRKKRGAAPLSNYRV